MRILSLGAGVQSSTLLLMACEGELQIDAAIFADTGWEPATVYEWLAFLERRAAEAGIPVYRVSGGDLRANAMAAESSAWIPMYLKNQDGSRGMLRRQCTKNYKIMPIRRKLRELGASRRNPVEQIFGISLDEIQRMRSPDVLYVTHVYPLIDLRMTRAHCLAWLTKKGYPEPQKSACVGCPYRRNAEWQVLTPAEMADAVEFDEAMRTRKHMRAETFLHDSLVPLALADLRSEQDRGQLDMFESDGCGVLCAGDLA
jgi:hypothetical protein